MNRDKEDNDLREEIFHLKKQLSSVTAENVLLKVKVRKLQNEVNKRDRQMDALFDTRVKSPYHEISASFVMNMKEKNDKLVKMLNDKELVIKRLNSQLDVKKLYTGRPLKKVVSPFPGFVSPISKKWSDLEEESPTLMEDELDLDEPSKKIDIKEQYKSLSKEHLLSIIESMKINQHRLSPRIMSRKSSPESDLERIELLCESPHEEIKQLHLYFLDMLAEVDDLKGTIARLENNQEKTDSFLKKKNNNIDKLAKEIKNLKNPGHTNKSKSARCKSSKSDDLLVRIYSAPSNNNNGGKNWKNKGPKPKRATFKSHSVKDVFVQVEDLPKIYVEESGVFIRHKTAHISKEEYNAINVREKEQCQDDSEEGSKVI